MPKPKQFCWLCGIERPKAGKCPKCRAPPTKPSGWIGSTYTDPKDPLFHPIENSKASATPNNSIEQKSTKRPYRKKNRGDPLPRGSYTTLTVLKTTLTALKTLRNRLPFSVSCKSMDELILELVKKEAQA